MSIKKLDDYRKKVEQIREEEEKDLEKNSTDNGGDEGPPMEFVKECYRSNEVGDSLLFNYLHRDKYVSNVMQTNYSWLRYVGPHWEPDHDKQALADVEQVVLQYLRMMPEIEKGLKDTRDLPAKDPDKKKWLTKHKKLIDRADKLRGDRGRKSVLACAVSNYDPLTIHPDQFDQHPWLLPVPNGIIDLLTGEFEEGGDPSLFLTKCSATTWKGIDYPCPEWEKYLLEALVEPETIDYLQKVLGYALTGLRSERIFVVFHGPHGQNGKGTLMNVVLEIMGDLSSTLQTEVLMSQRFSKGASGPSPEVIQFMGHRFLFAEETEKKHSFAAGMLKKYSGGGKLKGRGVGDKDYLEFDPVHVLFLICNDLPTAPADDDGFWERIKVFTFPYSFLPEQTKDHHKPVDRDLERRLFEEAPGILAWMVRGCLKWQKEGLVPPAKVKEDSRNYRKHEDDLQHWIDECCLVDFTNADRDNREQASLIYGNFTTWWGVNHPGTRSMSVKDFSDQMIKKGFTKTKDDKMYYNFIQLKHDAGE